MGAAPWTVRKLGDDAYRFCNATEERAEMVVVEGIGTRFFMDVGELDVGECFELGISLPGTGVRITWAAPGHVQRQSFDYQP